MGPLREWRAANVETPAPVERPPSFPANLVAEILKMTTEHFEELVPGLVDEDGWINTDEFLRRLAYSPPLYVRKPIPPSVRDSVIARDGRVCGYCLKTIGPRTRLHLDHIVPVSAGGTNELNNLVVACASCNSSKGRKMGYRRACGHLSWEVEYNFEFRPCPCGRGPQRRG